MPNLNSEPPTVKESPKGEDLYFKELENYKTRLATIFSKQAMAAMPKNAWTDDLASYNSGLLLDPSKGEAYSLVVRKADTWETDDYMLFASVADLPRVNEPVRFAGFNGLAFDWMISVTKGTPLSEITADTLIRYSLRPSQKKPVDGWSVPPPRRIIGPYGSQYTKAYQQVSETQDTTIPLHERHHRTWQSPTTNGADGLDGPHYCDDWGVDLLRHALSGTERIIENVQRLNQDKGTLYSRN